MHEPGGEVVPAANGISEVMRTAGHRMMTAVHPPWKITRGVYARAN